MLVGVDPMTGQKWFGREPALVLQTIAAALALLIGFSLPHLNDTLAAALMALLTAAAAAWTALHVRPIAPSIFGGLIAAGAVLVAQLGLHITQAQTGAVAALVAAVVALLTRSQQDYQDPVAVAVNAARPVRVPRSPLA
jgi:hypothetical protein